LEQAAKRADMVLLEPIMKIEVATPDEYMGDIIGDLSSRRCQIQGTQERAGLTVIDAIGPLANMRGYATGLRSLSKGRASFYMEPSHYDEVPANVAETIIEKGATN
jgi:elongation factor G